MPIPDENQDGDWGPEWTQLDSSSYDAVCADCGDVIVGKFSADGKAETPCGGCGSTNYEGMIGCPSGAGPLAQWRKP